MRNADEPMNTSPKLIFMCGKMAAGKSTLARITAYFQPPSENEGFNVVRHERS
jgi:pantothenate kinase